MTADAAQPIEEARIFEIAYERACLVVPNLVARAVSGRVQDHGAGYYVVFCAGEAGFQREVTLRLGREGNDTRVVVRAQTAVASVPDALASLGASSSRALPQITAIEKRTVAFRRAVGATIAFFLLFVLTPIVASALEKTAPISLMGATLAGGVLSLIRLSRLIFHNAAPTITIAPTDAGHTRMMLEAQARAQRETRERDVLVHKALRAVEDAVAGQTTSAHYRVAPQGRTLEPAREEAISEQR